MSLHRLPWHLVGVGCFVNLGMGKVHKRKLGQIVWIDDVTKTRQTLTTEYSYGYLFSD